VVRNTSGATPGEDAVGALEFQQSRWLLRRRLSQAYFDAQVRCPTDGSRQDNSVDVDDDGAMRLRVVLAGLAAVIGSAVPAQADPGSTDPGADASFLSQLSQAGITYGNGPAAVAAAHTACNMMDAGEKEIDVIKQVMTLNPGFGLAGSTRFTAIASSVYCPDYLSKSSAKTSNPVSPGLPGPS